MGHDRSELLFVKLGGSLITDKRRPESVRRAVLRRLAQEIAEGSRRGRARWILGHGGGSFGHAAAARHRLNRGPLEPGQLAGVSITQDRAARLHRIVIAELERAGVHPFSLAPSSLLTADAGRPVAARLEPLELALAHGLTPVVFGDVVLDRSWGACVCSTEQVFLTLIRRLRRRGYAVRRALWLGETEGVYDRGGGTIARATRADVRRILRHVEGAAGADVTGGMAHRLRAAARLAGLGVRSLILDGRVPGRLLEAAAGRRVPGTVVEP